MMARIMYLAVLALVVPASAQTLFVDDDRKVLRSAAAFGIGMLVEVTRPDTTRPVRDDPEFADIEAVSDLL